MERQIALKRFRQQRAFARARDIDWHFSFQEWLDWWGEELDSRGRGKSQLSMQRIGDVGPYAAWNVRKGTPAENAKTRGISTRNVKVSTAKFRPMVEREPPDQVTEDEEFLKKRLGLSRVSYW